MHNIEPGELRSLLERAYEEGYGGYLEMKGECIDRMVDEFLSSRQRTEPACFSTTTTTTTSNDQNLVAPYYIYSTMTVPHVEIVRRDEVL